MNKRTNEEVQAYVDGYNACYDRFIEEERIEDIINIYSLCVHSVTFDTDWWDKPYRTESK